MKVKIEKGTAYGTIFAPSSKSVAHRLLISAALSDGVSIISGISNCADIEATVRCLRALGVEINIDGERYTVIGKDMRRLPPTVDLDCGESGSTIRFLIPIAALSGNKVRFVGAGRLMERPFGVYEEIFGKQGLEFTRNGGIEVRGPLLPDVFTVPGNVSSQFISGLLFALPTLSDDSVIKIIPPLESKAYIDMTISALHTFGVSAYFEDELTIIIPGNQTYKATDAQVEGDYSGAAFPDALNLLGGHVTVDGLSEASLQSDKMYKSFYPLLDSGYADIDISGCPDLGPILFALASIKHGATIRGTARLRIKESDRVRAMTDELCKLGAVIDVYDDYVVIHNAPLHSPDKALRGHNDHRIVMALSILLTALGGEIEGAEAISKSYPEFFTHLQKLGLGITFYDYSY